MQVRTPGNDTKPSSSASHFHQHTAANLAEETTPEHIKNTACSLPPATAAHSLP